jgi:hypothetical protein
MRKIPRKTEGFVTRGREGCKGGGGPREEEGPAAKIVRPREEERPSETVRARLRPAKGGGEPREEVKPAAFIVQPREEEGPSETVWTHLRPEREGGEPREEVKPAALIERPQGGGGGRPKPVKTSVVLMHCLRSRIKMRRRQGGGQRRRFCHGTPEGGGTGARQEPYFP